VRLIVLCFSSLLKGTDCKEPQINPGRMPAIYALLHRSPWGHSRGTAAPAKLRRKKVSYSFKGIVKAERQKTLHHEARSHGESKDRWVCFGQPRDPAVRK